MRIAALFMSFVAILQGFVEAAPAAEPDAPAGWVGRSPREEIRPLFSYEPSGGPRGEGALVHVEHPALGQRQRQAVAHLKDAVEPRDLPLGHAVVMDEQAQHDGQAELEDDLLPRVEPVARAGLSAGGDRKSVV